MKTILITGGALRIGKVLTETFWKQGYNVVIHCNCSREAAETLRQQLEQHKVSDNQTAHVIQQDFLLPGAAATLFARLHEQHIFPDVLINNASTYRRSPLIELTSQEIEEDLHLNFTVPFELMQQMARQHNNASIINLLDQRITRTEPNSGTYGFAKKCLAHATELAAVEWAPDMRVNAIAPGMVLPPPGVDQEKIKALLENVPTQQQVSVQAIADAALFILSQPHLNGHILFLDGGQHLAPVVRQEVASGHYKGNS